jgi:hypothetical protein
VSSVLQPGLILSVSVSLSFSLCVYIYIYIHTHCVCVKKSLKRVLMFSVTKASSIDRLTNILKSVNYVREFSPQSISFLPWKMTNDGTCFAEYRKDSQGPCLTQLLTPRDLQPCLPCHRLLCNVSLSLMWREDVSFSSPWTWAGPQTSTLTSMKPWKSFVGLQAQAWQKAASSCPSVLESP